MKTFILEANKAEIVARQGNLTEKREFLKKVGSNLVLTDRKIKYFPRAAWEILAPLEISRMKNSDFVREKAKNGDQRFLTGLENLPVFGAEPRSGEAQIAFKKEENLQLLRN